MAEIQHGKPSTYNNHRCRCQECKTAWAKYQAPRVKAWREKQKPKKESEASVEVRF